MTVVSLFLSMMITSTPADTIRVGDPSLKANLSAGADTVDNYVVQDGKRRLAVIFVQTFTETPEGHLIVQENRSASGAILSLDSLVVADGTMETLWHGDVTPMGRRHVVFSGGRVRGVAVDSVGRETTIDEERPEGLFDYSVLTLVADRLPLGPGYEATIATYDITRGPVDVSIRVLAAESVTIGGIELGAWRMQVDFGRQSVTRWVERGTGRELRWSLSMEGRDMIGERRNAR